jgi:hypothetical protein
MADAELRQLWAAVRRDLDRARTLLPPQPVEGEGSLDRLAEWLDHNELDLALDELELLGEDNSAPAPFWQALRTAAERMGLTQHAGRLGQRAAGA